ncbi:MAG: glucokinase [Desulfobacterales bacterium]|nr:glucokinase [Desulfobacterales bacterium]
MVTKYILAGDIGGTKTSIGLFLKGKTRPVVNVSETYSSRDFSGLEEVLTSFTKKYPAKIEKACLGMAGPVINGRCNITNLPWHIDERKLQTQFKWPSTRIINDLTATAMMVTQLTAREYFTLNRARALKNGNIAVIAPGTGLGTSMLVYTGGGYLPVPSEGGHAGFVPDNKLEAELKVYLKKKYNYVSYERVASGPGIVDTFLFLRDTGKYGFPAWLQHEIKLKGVAIAATEGALKRKNPLCVKTLMIFLSALGSFTGNMALTGIATGGVYLAGGILPNILPAIETSIFMDVFKNRGQFQKLMEKMPVRIILNKNTALLGAAEYAFRH